MNDKLNQVDFVRATGLLLLCTSWMLLVLTGGCRQELPANYNEPPDSKNDELTVILSARPDNGSAPLTVDFSAVVKTPRNNSVYTLDYDFDGDGTWDMLDGGAGEAWTYGVAGSYLATVRASNSDGLEDSDSIPITITPGPEAPDAVLTASAEFADAPAQVTFDAGNSRDTDGMILRYDFDFDSDGIWDAYDAPSLVNWTFEEPGVYTVTVRVTDNDGEQDLAQLTIAVNALPIAIVTFTPVSPVAGQTVTFDAASSYDPDGVITNFRWDTDGNGTFEQDTGIASQVQVLFAEPGEYAVGVQVTDNRGARVTEIVQLAVN